MISSEIDFNIRKPQPLLIVISGPSGVGKDAVINELKNKKSSFAFVTTATSRLPRPNEVHGIDYFFVSKTEFERMIADDELIEYNLVYSDYKGVPKSQVKAALMTGKDTVLRVDVQGAYRLKTLFPEALLIFLVPDNSTVWLNRLQNRKTETEEELALRIRTAKKELEDVDWFDYVVTNAENHLAETVNLIESIITAEHHRVHHRVISI